MINAEDGYKCWRCYWFPCEACMLRLLDSHCILQYCSWLSFFKYTKSSFGNWSFEVSRIRKTQVKFRRDCKYSMDQDSQKNCATLDYIYHIFDKYVVSSALYRGSIRDLTFHVLLKSKDTLGSKMMGKENLKNTWLFLLNA